MRTIRIDPEIIGRCQHVVFEIGDENFAGQRWMGVLRGDEQIGQWSEVRRQIAADRYEYSRVQIVARETPVTGAILLTLRESDNVQQINA
jgi:hypothetical protein